MLRSIVIKTKPKFLLCFRNIFINKTIFSLIKIMFKAILIFLLINLSIYSFHAVCNYLFKNNLRINCVCYNANIMFFNITLISKKKD